MMNIRDRYLNDPAFSQLVDMMHAAIAGGTYTPTEVREAAMLAQIMYEQRHPRPIMFTEDQVRRGEV